jgi:hypothetical protein
VGSPEKRQPVCKKATTTTVMRLNSLIRTTAVEKLSQAALYSGHWVENQSGLGVPLKLSGEDVQRLWRQPKWIKNVEMNQIIYKKNTSTNPMMTR